MVASSFDAALARVLRHEGGYSNHPSDRGGVTLDGIIQRVYDAYRDRKGLKRRPLTPQMRGTSDWEDERDEIYRRNYWNLSRCDELPVGVDYATYDGSVNSGVGQSAKWLQRAVGVKADGVIGDVTIAAARRADPVAVINSMCDQRLAMLKGLKTWPVFGKGWSRRVADVRRDALAMVKAGSDNTRLPPAQLIPADEMAKGAPEDRSLSSIAKSPEGLAAGVSTIGAMVNAAENPGPMQWAIAAAVLIVVAVGAWFFIQRQRAA